MTPAGKARRSRLQARAVPAESIRLERKATGSEQAL